MKISIILPIYNTGKYLREALDSLTNQTYQNLDIVCVNDGSTDDSAEILSEYTKKESRIRVITQENMGTLAARKAGTEIAQGDYVMYLDPDDWFELETCEKVAAFIQNTGADIVQFGFSVECGVQGFEKYLEDISRFFNRRKDKIDGRDALLRAGYVEESISYNQCGKAIKTAIAKKAFGSLPSLRCNYAEDQCTGFFLFYYSNTYRSMSECYYHYRAGVGISTRTSMGIDDYIKTLASFDMLRVIENFVSLHHEKEELYHAITEKIRHSMVSAGTELGSERVQGYQHTDEWLVPLCEKGCATEVASILASKYNERKKENTVLLEKISKMGILEGIISNQEKWLTNGNLRRKRRHIRRTANPLVKDSVIVFGILARDCAKNLQKNIKRLEDLGRAFKDYYVVAYENDSVDGTTELLQEWARKNSHVLSINEITKQVTIPKQSQETPFPGQSYKRIKKMAAFRNRVLQEVRQRYTPDLFCFIDIDAEEFDPQSVVDAIDKAPKGWGGLFANGQVIIDFDQHPRINPIMYDYYAYVEKGVNPLKEKDYAVQIHKNQAVAWIAQRFINRQAYHSCTSAFNGIGIYRWEAVKDLDYVAFQTPELKAVNASLCEHVPFNYCIYCQGYGLYVVRDMKTQMVHINPPKIHHRWSKWKNHVPSYDFLKYNKSAKKQLVKYFFRYLWYNIKSVV